MKTNSEPIVRGKYVGGLIQRTLNHVDSRLIDHGKRVALMVSKMLIVQGKYSEKEQQEICFLSLLHDIGAYKTDEIDRLLEFESRDVQDHSVYGYLFLKYLSPVSRWAEAVLYHHIYAKELEALGAPLQDIAQMIQIADRADIFAMRPDFSADSWNAYTERVRGNHFQSGIIELFSKAEEQFHMLDGIKGELLFSEIAPAVAISEPEIDQCLKMLVYSIDFRSQFTVTHTITTTHISYQLAKFMNLEKPLRNHVYYAALLHDLGKIAIPVEILEFPGKLSPQAMDVMRTHVDFTEKILGGVIDPMTTNIALRHHEKLDGSGYPRGLAADALTVPDRIVAIADIISALLGARSYKGSFSKEKTLSILRAQADEGKLDPQIVAMVTERFDMILDRVNRHCEPILTIYSNIQTEFQKYLDYKKDHPGEHQHALSRLQTHGPAI